MSDPGDFFKSAFLTKLLLDNQYGQENSGR